MELTRLPQYHGVVSLPTNVPRLCLEGSTMHTDRRGSLGLGGFAISASLSPAFGAITFIRIRIVVPVTDAVARFEILELYYENISASRAFDESLRLRLTIFFVEARNWSFVALVLKEMVFTEA